jgi:uncharacterized protein (TIGR02145 family)
MSDTGAVCYGLFDPEYVHDLLYNWEAAADACPDGWRLPTDNDWKLIEMYVGIDYSELDIEGDRGSFENAVKLMHYFDGLALDYASLINQTGFSAVLTSNMYAPHDGGYYMIFWTSTPGLIREIKYYPGSIFRGFVGISSGHTVRCIKD